MFVQARKCQLAEAPLHWQAWAPSVGTDKVVRYSLFSEVSMKAAALSFMFCLAFLAAQNTALARDAVLPAGTLMQCTLDEPNFSSATASVGDPVLCYPHGLQFFGQTLFPRGTYIVGHLADDKDPGHFWGKGYLKIEFDRIGLPSADVPLSAKIVAVSGGYRVDKEGKIIGKGHAKRDVAEWLFPPLWPWKIITLPARGPRPALKGESRVTLRLMDDVLIPDAASYRRFGQLDTGETYAHPALYIRPQKKLAAPSGLSEPSYRSISWEPQAGAAAGTQITSANAPAPATDHSGWHSFGRKSAAPVNSSAATVAMDATPEPAATRTSAADAPDDTTAAVDNTTAPVKVRPAINEQDIPPMNTPAAQTSAVPAVKLVAATPATAADSASTADPAALVKTLPNENTLAATTPAAPTQKPKLTLFALRAGTVYAVTDYWRNEDQLGYVLSNGKEGQIDLGELDWKTTTQLNTERNVKVTLREGR
jgi:hypothetical protein